MIKITNIKVMIHPKWKNYEKHLGIERYKEYVVKSVYCTSMNISLTLFDSENVNLNNMNLINI